MVVNSVLTLGWFDIKRGMGGWALEVWAKGSKV